MENENNKFKKKKKRKDLAVAGEAESGLVGGAEEDRGGALADIAERSHSSPFFVFLVKSTWFSLVSLVVHFTER